MIVARPLDQIKPVHLVLQADTVPTTKALAEFFPAARCRASFGARLT